MSRVTYERLGAPKAFNVLFDTTNNVIGLKPAALTARNAYLACVTGPRGGRVVNAFRLIQDHNIHLPDTVQFHDAEIDPDGILILDLRTARISERSAAHYRRHRKRTPEGTYPSDSGNS